MQYLAREVPVVERLAGVGDITTLANPEIVDQTRDQVQTAKKASGQVPGELSAAEAEEIEKFGSVG